MMESHHALLTALDRLGIRMDIDGDRIKATGHTERITAAMADQIKSLKPQLLAEFDARAHRTADLAAGIDGATDWRALEAVIAATHDLFRQGRIGRHQAEEVARLSVVKGRTIPAYVPPEEDPNATYWPEPKKRDTCYACGNRVWWWDADDNRKCGTCHPRPVGRTAYKPVVKIL